VPGGPGSETVSRNRRNGHDQRRDDRKLCGHEPDAARVGIPIVHEEPPTDHLADGSKRARRLMVPFKSACSMAASGVRWRTKSSAALHRVRRSAANASGNAPVPDRPALGPHHLPLYRDLIDGIYGQHTRDPVPGLLLAEAVADGTAWSGDQLIVAGKQMVCKLDGIETSDVDGIQSPRFGGCLNVHKMRGGSAWSMHSWGIAFDFDPDRNQLTWKKDRAAFQPSEYANWFELWEEEGAISLGRSPNYDWMHTQFCGDLGGCKQQTPRPTYCNVPGPLRFVECACGR
jgi:hypothetical protein